VLPEEFGIPEEHKLYSSSKFREYYLQVREMLQPVVETLHRERLHNLCSASNWSDQIKKDTINEICSMRDDREKKIVVKFSFRKSQGTIPFMELRCDNLF
jgi:hypothetical protein